MLSKREWHTCAGIKVNDAKAIDPRSGLSLFGDPNKPGYQGLNHLFVMKMVMHRETNDLVYGAFQDFYDFWESCQSDHTNPLSPGHPSDHVHRQMPPFDDLERSCTWRHSKGGKVCLPLLWHQQAIVGQTKRSTL
jgi:hypothetical protein